jgi:ribosomal protein L34
VDRNIKPTIEGRIRVLGNYLTRQETKDGQKVELWEGGRLVGYERIRPDRKNCWRPGIR